MNRFAQWIAPATLVALTGSSSAFAAEPSATPVDVTNPEYVQKRINQLAEAYNKGDVQAALDVFHEDVVFDWGSIRSNPWYGLGKGKEDILKGWAWNGEHLEDSSYRILDTTVNGNISYSRAHETFKVKATGKLVDCPVLAEHHWKDGKIVFWREYFCQAAFLDALGMIDAVAPDAFRRSEAEAK